jgi:hypothetical protein
MKQLPSGRASISFEVIPSSFGETRRFGQGSWAFSFSKYPMGNELSDPKRTFWFNGMYRDAKKAARTWALTQMGEGVVVYVLP